MIDYRKLLKAYINHVIAYENYDFIRKEGVSGLSDEENGELLHVCDEAWSERERDTRDLADLISGLTPIETPLLQAVRKGGVGGTTPFTGFKEGQIVTGKGLKPGVVTIAKDGTVVLIPKDE